MLIKYMSSTQTFTSLQEFEAYKNNKIKELTIKFIAEYNSLVKKYNETIKKVQISYMLNRIKINKINSLYLELNGLLKNLRAKYDADVLAIKNLSIPNFTQQTQVPTQTQVPIQTYKNKKALLIGINYVGTQYELHGCINDQTAINDKIKETGFNASNIVLVNDNTSVKPTRNNILSEFDKFTKNSSSGDLLMFYYSGHGSYAVDRNGDEKDKRDELICSSDLYGVTDDELKQIIQTNIKQGVTMFALFDSCFSGSVLDLKYTYIDSLTNNMDTQNSNDAETLGNIVMISGCTDNQTSAETVINDIPQGALTGAFLETLKSNKTPTWKELISSMRDLLKKNGYTQIPQLSSGKSLDINSKCYLFA